MQQALLSRKITLVTDFTHDLTLAVEMPLMIILNPLSANPTKWSNTLKQFVGNLLTNCLSMLDHFVGLALKGLK